MDDFFQNTIASGKKEDELSKTHAPLASRMRPRTLQEYSGQTHLLSEGKLLRRAMEADRISSMILYGPPGIGKTSLARVIAHHTQSHFIEISGVEGSVADLRKAMGTALQQSREGKREVKVKGKREEDRPGQKKTKRLINKFKK